MGHRHAIVKIPQKSRQLSRKANDRYKMMQPDAIRLSPSLTR